MEELAEEVKATLLDLSPSSPPHLDIKRCQWKTGTTVEVTLHARDLLVEPQSQTFVWNGTKTILEFDVAVPENAKPRVVVLKFDVSVDAIVVAVLRIDLEIVPPNAGVRAMRSAIVSASTKAARTAFASYSSTDRQRVLDRVAAVSISAGLEVFLDCLSLHPGLEWREQLETEITHRDLFLLFWSAAAAKSEYVSWEWRTALHYRGKENMQIHPLEVGLAPPQELGDLHFGDPYMLARRATDPSA